MSSSVRNANPAPYPVSGTQSYSSGPGYPQQDGYGNQPQYDSRSHADASRPQIRNPFVPPTSGGGPAYGGAQAVDPEMEAQILQWQSAYVGKDDSSSNHQKREGATGANSAPLGSSRPESASIGPTSHSTTKDGPKTVHRSGGGTTWTDSTLLDWNPAHSRLFVGNLAGEVTDESLLKAFSKYPSVEKARVVRDKRTTKSKGYGFVSFSDGDDYFAAGRDMQGKYIGSHPVLIKRSNTEVKATPIHQGNKHGKHEKGGKGRSGNRHGKVEHGGVNKKQPKTKGGYKLIG